MIRYSPEALRVLCHSTLVSAGVDSHDAMVVADNLIAADRRGIHSHGLARLPLYLAKAEAGSIAKKTVLRVVNETPAAILIDAGNGWGPVAAKFAMNQAILKATKAGMATAGVRNSNHFGIASYYGMQAVMCKMIGLVLTNSVPAMAPWGGTEAYLGTNPICLCVPAGDERPVVYDGATSVVAKGWVTLAHKAGARIPLTWGADKRGRPTDDPGLALDGSLLPIGGYKGSGLSMAVDILCGVLTGTAFAGDVGSLFNDWQVAHIGHFMMAINVEVFMPVGEFEKRVSELVRGMKGNPLAEGVGRIYVPGEIEAEKEMESDHRGIALQPEIIRDLEACARKYGLTLPSPQEGNGQAPPFQPGSSPPTKRDQKPAPPPRPA